MQDAPEPANSKSYPTMSADEFLDWDGDGHRGKMELVGGRIVAMSPSSATHGIIQGNLMTLINNQIWTCGLPLCAGTEIPVVPVLGLGRTIRVPDIAVTAAPASDSKTLPEPILSVEVISPTNENDTWESIAALAGLISMREVLVVHSTRFEVEVYRKNTETGGWPIDANSSTRELNGSVRLDSLDMELSSRDVYRSTHLVTSTTSNSNDAARDE